jgi:phosphatidylglycerophosphate synthase
VYRRSAVSAINRKIRSAYESLMRPPGILLSRAGFSANLVTVFSVVLAAAAALAFGSRNLTLGLGLLVASVLVDMLDGSVARASRGETGVGTMLDHTADRYSEFLYVFGICYGGYAPFWLGMLCYFSMLMPSYVRAKAETSGASASVQGVGIAERKEKLSILIVSAALLLVWRDALYYGMIIITILSQISAFQRLHFASGSGRGAEAQPCPESGDSSVCGGDVKTGGDGVCGSDRVGGRGRETGGST